MTLGQILRPQFGIAAKPLVIGVESPKEILTFQRVDGRVNDVDNGALTSFGQRLESLGIWPADAHGCRFCCHAAIVDEL